MLYKNKYYIINSFSTFRGIMNDWRSLEAVKEWINSRRNGSSYKEGIVFVTNGKINIEE